MPFGVLAAETAAEPEEGYIYENGVDAWQEDSLIIYKENGSVLLQDGDMLIDCPAEYPPLTEVIFGAEPSDRFTYTCNVSVNKILSQSSFISLILGFESETECLLLSLYPNGRVCLEKRVGEYEYIPLAEGYSGLPLNTEGAFELSAVSDDGTLHFFVAGKCVLEAALPHFAGQGNVGICGKGISCRVHEVSFTHTAGDLVSINDTLENDVYLPKTGINSPPVIIVNDSHGLTLEKGKARGAFIQFSVEEREGVLCSVSENEVIGALKDRVEAVRNLAFLSFVVNGKTEAQLLADFIKKEKLNGVTVISREADILDTFDFGLTLKAVEITSKDALSAVSLCRESGARTAVISKDVSKDAVRKMKALGINVWIKCGDTAVSALECAALGADGIIVSGAGGALSAFGAVRRDVLTHIPVALYMGQTIEDALAAASEGFDGAVIKTGTDGTALTAVLEAFCTEYPDFVLYLEHSGSTEELWREVCDCGMENSAVFVSDDMLEISKAAALGLFTLYNGEELTLTEAVSCAAGYGCAVSRGEGGELYSYLGNMGVSVIEAPAAQAEAPHGGILYLDASLDDANRITATAVYRNGRREGVTVNGCISYYGSVAISGDYLDGEGTAAVYIDLDGTLLVSSPVNVGEVTSEGEDKKPDDVKEPVDISVFIISGSLVILVIGLVIAAISVKKGKRGDKE